jgi:CspA family cold shock protein
MKGANMSKGTVKKFDKEKGYGFLVLEDAREVFFHYSTIQGSGFKTTEAGDSVEVEYFETPKGLKASKVTVTH